MKNFPVAFLALAIAVVATHGAFGVETSLTDYSRAVIADNPMYYWTFNEAGATDASNDVMHYEPEGQMLAVGDATRTASYSTELGTAASFNDNAAFWGGLINRGYTPGAYAVEFWMKADAGAPSGYIADFLGTPISGDSPGIISNYNAGYTELWYGGARTGTTSELNISDGDWHHVVLAVNCDAVSGTLDQIDVAIDGVVSTNVAAIDAKQLNATGVLTIGAWATTDENGYAPGTTATGAGSCFQGQIDEFAIYELGGMDATQVAAKVASLANHYNLATAPVEIAPYEPVPASKISYSVIEGNEPYASYADDTGVMLIDGIYAGSDNTSYAQKAVGYYGNAAIGEDYTVLEFDLSEVTTLDSIWIDYLGAGGRYGINAPVSVELSFSTDGVNFTEPMLVEEFNNTTDPNKTYFNERRLQIDLDNIDAQYVRAEFGFLTNFVFLSEVQFNEAVSDVPEPSTIVLLVSAFASLLIWRRAR